MNEEQLEARVDSILRHQLTLIELMKTLTHVVELQNDELKQLHEWNVTLLTGLKKMVQEKGDKPLDEKIINK